MSLPGMGAASFGAFSKAGQSAWRTPYASTYLYTPVDSFSVEKKETTSYSTQARGGEEQFGRAGETSVEGSLAMDVYADNLDPLLSNCMVRSVDTINVASLAFSRAYTLPYDLALQQVYGMTLYGGLGLNTMEVRSAAVNSLKFTMANNFMKCEAGIVAAERAFIANPTPSFGASLPYTVAGKLTVALTGGTGTVYPNVPVRGFTLTVPFPTQMLKSDSDIYAASMARSGKVRPTMQWNWEYQDLPTGFLDDLRTAWDSKQRIQATITITGAVLSGAYVETLTFFLPWLFRSGADPKVAGSGPIGHSYVFEAQRDHLLGVSALTITTKNGVAYP